MSNDPLDLFHPAVAAWFRDRLGVPTEAQAAAWPAIRRGEHVLVAAPTGSGKTLTGFLAAIDTLVREGVAAGGELPAQTQVLYVSPLKALSNDIQINLETPLQGIAEQLQQRGLPLPPIRTAVRTGDTPQTERSRMRRQPPHMLVTTPESLYVLLGSDSGRQMLATVRTVIVDEIHAVADDKRGAHLALSLERLQALCKQPLQRIGLSATQKPIEAVARFLVGAGEADDAPPVATMPVDSSTGTNTTVPAATPPTACTKAPATVLARANQAPPTRRSSQPGKQSITPDKPPSPTARPAAIANPAPPEAAASTADDGAASGRPADTPAAVVSTAGAACTLIDIGHHRQRDLALELTAVPLEAVMSIDAWGLVYDRIAQLVQQHRTTLVFVNTRRLAERATRQLSERLGKAVVAAHHGSLAREQRLDAEQRLKRGELRVLVATASLELGIDIGDVELVCQLSSPRSINTFLQRVGRAGHSVGGVPKARLFPTSRDDLVECTALLDAVRRGELDTLVMPPAPLDVLAQQIIAEVASQDWDEQALYRLIRRAWPYRSLSYSHYQALLRMLAEGFTTRQGARAAYIHRDAVAGQLRARRGARLTASTSGGTIPDTADYQVILEPQATPIGTVNEDFAIESLAGDVFQLGNRSYRILRVESGKLRVEDAQGLPPNIPFWIGEAPGRSDELSHAVSRLREALQQQLEQGGVAAATGWLAEQLGLDEAARSQLVDYLARARLALGGVLPTQRTLLMERFFDESGGTQLIIHSPYGSRLNRAWGLALRKRFCRQFNFELQAAATEDAIVLSLSTSHSFPLDEVARYLHSASAEQVLTQALLDAPLFPARWRWNATNALALPRMSGGKRTPPQLMRMRSEDLLAAVFPDQVACLENIVGEREVPDHPLVEQTLYDCLRVAMDTDGLLQLLRRIEAGQVQVLSRELTAPSPLAAEVLGAAPYAFLDDAPLEERRTQAVQARRWGELDGASDLARLDPQAIQAVRQEAWPQVRSADEMHEALMVLGAVSQTEAQQQAWLPLLQALAQARRATRLEGNDGRWAIWVAAERLPAWLALQPQAQPQPPIAAPAAYAGEHWSAEAALTELLRARLSGLGPVVVSELAGTLGVTPSEIELALLTLQGQGYVMQGHFSPDCHEPEWCERHLLARIHRYTVNALRREIEPVSRAVLMRFLLEWQHLDGDSQPRGPEALPAVLAQLEGFEAAAGSWEAELLPARLADYNPGWLDELCRAGRIGWQRLRPGSARAALRSTPIVLMPRRQMAIWASITDEEAAPPPSSRAQAVLELLGAQGALFFDELQQDSRLLRTELEDALGELVASGRISADSFAGLRALLVPAGRRQQPQRRRLQRRLLGGIEDAGRWSLLRSSHARTVDADEALEHIARSLLKRYGVVFWQLLQREASWLPPWRSLLRVYQRLEARGEIRGGRFVDGMVGEQFALPEALARLRTLRQTPPDGRLVAIAASDPLNLLGSLLPGQRLPSVAGNRLLLRDGAALATLTAGKLQWLQPIDSAIQASAEAMLRRQAMPYLGRPLSAY